VTITVNPRAHRTFSIRVRVPDREGSDIYNNEPKANGILSIEVNGQEIRPPIEKGYAVIERAWKVGDRIHLELPMQVQRVRAVDKVEATRGQVALRCDPLIYSFEAVDQDLDRALSPDARLTAEWEPGLLQGVLAIKGRWDDGSDLLAIPNYARANRLEEAGDDGNSRGREINSKVWIKESGD
jgi:DUF1680 family protein